MSDLKPFNQIGTHDMMISQVLSALAEEVRERGDIGTPDGPSIEDFLISWSRVFLSIDVDLAWENLTQLLERQAQRYLADPAMAAAIPLAEAYMADQESDEKAQALTDWVEENLPGEKSDG